MVGRTQELKRIKALINSQRSDFLALTGRRRIGKTYLIDLALRDHYCFTMVGIQNGSTQEQLVNFGIKLAEYQQAAMPGTPENWQEAFFQLKTYLQGLDRDRKQVIFIDELPWVSTPRSGFIQQLAHLWNDYLSKESHFLLVICGSASSWITKHILNDPGGLHNRVTEVIHLQPFTLAESNLLLEGKGVRMSSQEVARIYMAFGGIPFYLEQINRGESFPVAIERICFENRGILRHEYNNLYPALFKNSEIHQKIVSVLASKPYGMTNEDIQEHLKDYSTGSYHRSLQELLISGFIMEHRPFGRKKRGTLYRLTDAYSIFYHRFIAPNHRYVPGIWQQLAGSQSYSTWAGYAFENLCNLHLKQIKRALGIEAVYAEFSSLRIPGSELGPGCQIDLIIDRKDETINLCEMKFHGGEFVIDKVEYQKLIQRGQRFIEYTGTRKQVFITFITNRGVFKNEYARELVDAEVVLEDLMD